MNPFPTICVLIPTFNNFGEIEETVQSVYSQNYKKDNIYFLLVDYGSTDGTLEKIYRLPKKRTGVFSLSHIPSGRAMLAHALRIYNYQCIAQRLMVLYPGQIIYPDCFDIAERLLSETYKRYNINSSLIFEVDIKMNDGTIEHQQSIFTDNNFLRARSLCSSQYVKTGYRHQIMLYGFSYSCGLDKSAAYNNSLVHWNQLSNIGLGTHFTYTKHVLGCCKEYLPEDEIDDLAFRLESGISCFRMGQDNPSIYVLGNDYENNFRFNLAKYALWRSWKLLKNNNRQDAEKCFLFSRIIDKRMKHNEAWQRFASLFNSYCDENWSWVENWVNAPEVQIIPDNCLC